MAGNKLNTKTKDRGKITKSGVSNKDGDDDPGPDFSLLRKPIATSITGFGQAKKIFEKGTDELRTLLSRECDILYECKVCRNLFRSLANFISHKRVYCQEKFNASVHARFNRCSVDETLKIMKLEEEYQDFVKNKRKDQVPAQETNPPLTKDITALLERSLERDIDTEQGPIRSLNMTDIPSSDAAVFQSTTPVVNNNKDTMRDEVKELNDIISKDCAVLLADGKFEQVAESEVFQLEKQQLQVANSEPVIQISDDDEDPVNLVCKICEVTFSTLKTYKFHMKCKHQENRKVYPCPDCLELFSTSWSVFRHLFKVHRKTAAQIRRLRDSIQAKAFRLNEPPAFYERRRNVKSQLPTAAKITEEERIDQENQAWMENMELDGEVPRCGGCGRRFERRAALAAHTHTCQQRQNAIRTRTPIHIQVRRDYNKPPRPLNEKSFDEGSKDEINKESPEKEKEENDDEVNEDTDMKDETTKPEENTDEKAPESDKIENNDNAEDEDIEMDTLEQIDVSQEKNLSVVLAQTVEKENLEALKVLMHDKVDIMKVYCKICCRKYSKVHSLFRHMAQHYNWKRYACKLCNYTIFEKDKMPLHVSKVHKLKGTSEFYNTTIKILSAAEATQMCNTSVNDVECEETSPASRRESRCSSESSRFSDNDSLSSNTAMEIAKRKRDTNEDPNPSGLKKQKEDKPAETNKKETKTDGQANPSKPISMHKVMQVIFGDGNENKEDTKISGEEGKPNSSNLMRRPIRKKSKPKYADFEYDLSNLLKKEAESYRESLYPTATDKKIKEPIVKNNMKRKSSNESLETTPTKIENNESAVSMSSTSPVKIYTNAVINLAMSAISQARAHPSFFLSAKAGVAKLPQYTKTAPVKVFKLPVQLQPPDIKPIANKETEVKNSNVIDLDSMNNDSKTNSIDTDKVNDTIIASSNLDKAKPPFADKPASKVVQSGTKTKILVIKGPFNKSNSAPVKIQTLKPLSDIKKVMLDTVPPVEEAKKIESQETNGDSDLSCKEVVEDEIDEKSEERGENVKEITDPVRA